MRVGGWVFGKEGWEFANKKKLDKRLFESYIESMRIERLFDLFDMCPRRPKCDPLA
jgi:hypothetical protein